MHSIHEDTIRSVQDEEDSKLSICESYKSSIGGTVKVATDRRRGSRNKFLDLTFDESLVLYEDINGETKASFCPIEVNSPEASMSEKVCIIYWISNYFFKLTKTLIH